jgi:hypothetical protein
MRSVTPERFRAASAKGAGTIDARVLRVNRLPPSVNARGGSSFVVMHAGSREGVRIDDVFFLKRFYSPIPGFVTCVDETTCVIEVPRPDAWLVDDIKAGDSASTDPQHVGSILR